MTTTARVSVLLLAVACASRGPLDEGVHCEDQATEIGFDDPTALGFTANELLAGIPATETAALRWADDTTATLSLGWTAGSVARFVDSEAVYPDDGEEHTLMAAICDDRVEVDGLLVLATDDGAFDETFSLTVAGSTPDAAVSIPLDLEQLGGTFELEPFVEADDYDELSASIRISWAAGASAGVIEGQASGGEDCEDGDTCTAWAELVEVAEWGAPAE